MKNVEKKVGIVKSLLLNVILKESLYYIFFANKGI